MRSERPLIASMLFLATGLTLIFGYCTGTSSFSAGFPVASSSLHVDLTTIGPAALGGVALVAAGVLLLVWALLMAIVGQISLLFHRADEDDEVITTGRIYE
jgi:hypothetical protein